MTDNPQWQSPGGSGHPPVAGWSGDFVPPVPDRAATGQGWTGAPQQPGYAQQQPGWTPPPKPGLIPLRPLSFGTILGAPYQLLRRNPRPTFGVSVLIQGSTLFLTLGLVGLAAYFSLSRIDFATTEEDANDIAAGAFALILLVALIPVALSIVATGLMQGVIVLEVARQSVGDRLRFPQLWARAKGRIWAVAGYTVILTVVLFLAIAVLVGVVVALSLLGPAGIATGVALAILLVLGLVVLGAWIGTKLAFVPSVIMLERATIRQAIVRSWRLTDRVFWRTFGTLLLVAVILNTASSIVSAPLQLVGGFLPLLFAPTGDPTVSIVVLIVVYVLTLIATVVISAVILVIQSATTALLYIDQRMRKEALDLDLARYVEARQAGAGEPADPYEVVPAAGAAQPNASPWV